MQAIVPCRGKSFRLTIALEIRTLARPLLHLLLLLLAILRAPVIKTCVADRTGNPPTLTVEHCAVPPTIITVLPANLATTRSIRALALEAATAIPTTAAAVQLPLAAVTVGRTPTPNAKQIASTTARVPTETRASPT